MCHCYSYSVRKSTDNKKPPSIAVPELDSERKNSKVHKKFLKANGWKSYIEIVYSIFLQKRLIMGSKFALLDPKTEYNVYLA